MSETLDLFKAALGLGEPWRVTRSDFDVAQGRPVSTCPAQPWNVRRGDKWRSFAELNGAVLAAPKDICAGHSVGAVGGRLAKSSR